MYLHKDFFCCCFCKFADPDFDNDFLVYCSFRGFPVPYDYICCHFQEFVT